MTNLRKIVLFALILGTFVVYLTSCEPEGILEDNVTNTIHERSSDAKGNLISEEDIDEFIVKNIKQNQKPFEWKDASDEMIYSAIMHTDSILSIGYVPQPNITLQEFYKNDGVKKSTMVNKGLSTEFIVKRDEIISAVLKHEKQYRQQANLRLDEILVTGYDKYLPHIYLKVTDPNIISLLRNNDFVTYVEPRWYDLSKMMSKDGAYRSYFTGHYNPLGCLSPGPDEISVHDFDINNGSKVSWNYALNGITDAWDTPISAPGKSAGEGIGICIIDTGTSYSQRNLGGEFDSGLSSSGRVIDKLSTLFIPTYNVVQPFPLPVLGPTPSLSTPYDNCGHGTAMAGIAAAPLAGDGNMVGVAYKSNLLAIKALHDVWLNSGDETDAVVDAILIAAMDNSIRIISMSVGSPIASSSRITDAITTASIDMDKLVFCAAGTLFEGITLPNVIFPANLDSELTLAITGVSLNYNTNLTETCARCFDGPEVDFVVVMEKERKGNKIGPLALPSVVDNASDDRPKYSGGSSCATATAAGIAALVWAAHPNESKSQIINRLVASTSPALFNNTPYHGHGVINAAAAINIVE